MIIQVKPCPFLAAACDWLKSGFLLRARVSLSQSDGYYDIDYKLYFCYYTGDSPGPLFINQKLHLTPQSHKHISPAQSAKNDWSLFVLVLHYHETYFTFTLLSWGFWTRKREHYLHDFKIYFSDL